MKHLCPASSRMSESKGNQIEVRSLFWTRINARTSESMRLCRCYIANRCPTIDKRIFEFLRKAAYLPLMASPK